MKEPINYIHDRKRSFVSIILAVILDMIGRKYTIEKIIRTGKYKHEPAPIPKSVLENSGLTLSELDHRKIFILRPRQQGAEKKTILYLHGGGYISNIVKQHWQLIGELLIKTGATFVVPDYPLAPLAHYPDVYNFIRKIYMEEVSSKGPENLVMMGDSAGAGFAAGFVQTLRDEKQPQPSKLILISPWLDASVSDPEIIKIDKKDKMLSIEGLRNARDVYVGDMDPKDYRISPLYGDFSGISSEITLFTSTFDMLNIEARKLRQKMVDSKIPLNFFEYPGMIHDWLVITALPESRHAIDQIASLVNGSS